MSIIAIDCGASFIKAARLDETNASIKKELYFKTSEKSEMEDIDSDDEALPCKLRKTLSVVKKCILELSSPGEEIILGMSNEMHGFVLTNNELVPYMDYVSWQDELTAKDYDCKVSWHEYLQEQLEKDDIERTGMPFKRGLPSANLAYLLQDKSVQGELFCLFTLGDFLLSRLTGMHMPCHETNAAATGLYDLRTGDWNWKLIEKLQLQQIVFPKIIKDKCCKTIEWNGRKLMVFPSIGDQQAALLGSGLESDTQLSVNMGTGGQVAKISKDCVISANYQTRPYFNGLYLKTVPHIPSGRALNVFYNFIKQIASVFAPDVNDEKIWSWILAETQKSRFENEQNMQVDMSFFTNAVTSCTKGSIQGIEEGSYSVGNLFCAIYNQMAQNVITCADRILEHNAVPTEIVFSGGISNRHPMFREYVMEYFVNATEKRSQNETFLGIYRYVS